MYRLAGSTVIAVLALWLAVQPASAGASDEVVSFPMTDFLGETTMLSARLLRPDGDGPFPAVVLLHGCSGMSYDYPWAEKAHLPWGFLRRDYVLLEVDSFGPRGVVSVCEENVGFKAGPILRARDAHAGKDFLSSLPYVDDNRIAVMGWSHGGMTTLAAVSNRARNEPLRPAPFKAAIAFYPRCDFKLHRVDAPLLVLIGDADDWTHVEYCRQMELTGEVPHEYQLIVYPGATHSFDWVDSPGEYLGHKIIYDPAATEDAYRRTREFLERHLE